MKFTIYQESRVGRRANNQDRLLYRYTPEALLMVVADGMGGHSHGEVAAQVATVRIAKHFEQQAKPRIDDPARFLIEAFFDAHLGVRALAGDQPRPPHTTCVACVVQDGRAWWAHAGDSRLYLIRDGRLLLRTHDHSYVENLVRQGLLRADEAAKHPQRNVVLSCLGALEDPCVDREACELEAGDVMLLCSDGVWEPLREQTLVAAFSRGDLATVAPRVLDLAQSSAGDNGDNATLIAMRWEDNNGGPVTVARFPDTVVDASYGTSPELLSDADIDRAVAEIQTRLKHK